MNSHELAKILLAQPVMPVCWMNDFSGVAHVDVTHVDTFEHRGRRYAVLHDDAEHVHPLAKRIERLYPRPPGVNRPTLENIGRYQPDYLGTRGDGREGYGD